MHEYGWEAQMCISVRVETISLRGSHSLRTGPHNAWTMTVPLAVMEIPALSPAAFGGRPRRVFVPAAAGGGPRAPQPPNDFGHSPNIAISTKNARAQRAAARCGASAHGPTVPSSAHCTCAGHRRVRTRCHKWISAARCAQPPDGCKKRQKFRTRPLSVPKSWRLCAPDLAHGSAGVSCSV